jgi:hypothetical protein
MTPERDDDALVQYLAERIGEDKIPHILRFAPKDADRRVAYLADFLRNWTREQQRKPRGLRFEVGDAIWEREDLVVQAKAIVAYLVRRANADGRCFPGLDTIARATSVGTKTVKRERNVLRQKNILSWSLRRTENGAVCEYLLHRPADWAPDAGRLESPRRTRTSFSTAP